MYSPVLTCAGAVIWKRADSDSSSCANAIGTLAGVAFHPAGSSNATDTCAVPLVLLVTETWISRCTAFATGNTASGGVILTENSGTTFSSIRLSPV